MTLTHIITGSSKQPLQYQEFCEAIQGRGLVGDRYYYGNGTFNKPQLDQSVREISIIPYESLQECNDRLESNLDFKDLRRNLVIKNFYYEKLKNKEFKIGSASFKIVRTAPPCKYLSKLLGVDMMKGLKYIGGYRAVVIQSGLIRVGDILQFDWD